MSVYAGPEIPNNGLVVHLDSANERSYPRSGNTWFDISGNNLHWTLQGNPTWFEAGQYFRFNGSNQWAERNGGMHNPDNANTTVNMWFRPVSTPVSNKPVWSDNFGPEWGIWIDQANNVRSYVYGASSATNVPNNTWVNITMTHFSPAPNSGQAYSHSHYVNGNLIQANRSGTVGNGLNDNPMCIARDARTDLIQYSNIDCAIWQLYNRRLSDDEVVNLFYAYKGRFGL